MTESRHRTKNRKDRPAPGTSGKNYDEEKRTKAALKGSVTKALTSRAHRRPKPGDPPSYRASQLVEAYFDAAMEVIDHHLKNGSLQAAMFVVQKHLDNLGSRLEKPIELPANATPQQAAEKVVNLMLKGEISIEMGHKLISVIERQAGINAADEIDKLRQMVDDLLGNNAKVVNGQVQSQSPAWLKLQAQAPQPEPEDRDPLN